MSDKPHIFLVEDDLSFGGVLKSYLEINDFDVTWIDDGKYAVERFRNGSFGLCILDVMLPNVDGFGIATSIRKTDSQVPLIFLTAKALKEDIMKGYRTGADDYITKPFDTEVLLCKIRAIIKRKENGIINNVKEFNIGAYFFDYKLRQISFKGQVQKLSPKEADLLKLLCEHPNELLSRETTLNKIWGDDGYFTARSMDVFITKLRKYLAADPSIEIKIFTEVDFFLQ